MGGLIPLWKAPQRGRLQHRGMNYKVGSNMKWKGHLSRGISWRLYKEPNLSYDSVSRASAASGVRAMLLCKQCKRCFQWTKTFQRHMRNIHDAVRYKYHACTKTFNRKDSFVRHKKRMHKAHEIFGVSVCCEQQSVGEQNSVTANNDVGTTQIIRENVWFP